MDGQLRCYVLCSRIHPSCLWSEWNCRLHTRRRYYWQLETSFNRYAVRWCYLGARHASNKSLRRIMVPLEYSCGLCEDDRNCHKRLEYKCCFYVKHCCWLDRWRHTTRLCWPPDLHSIRKAGHRIHWHKDQFPCRHCQLLYILGIRRRRCRSPSSSCTGSRSLYCLLRRLRLEILFAITLNLL